MLANSSYRAVVRRRPRPPETLPTRRRDVARCELRTLFLHAAAAHDVIRDSSLGARRRPAATLNQRPQFFSDDDERVEKNTQL